MQPPLLRGHQYACGPLPSPSKLQPHNALGNRTRGVDVTLSVMLKKFDERYSLVEFTAENVSNLAIHYPLDFRARKPVEVIRAATLPSPRFRRLMCPVSKPSGSSSISRYGSTTASTFVCSR
jgi:hypothetical protein